MGLLVEGVWHDKWYDTSKTGGRFQRSKSQFRDFVTKDGTPVEGRERGFKAEPRRYGRPPVGRIYYSEQF